MTPEMHLAMMRDPMRWSQVVLPVKRGDYMHTDDGLGVLIGDGRPIVYLVNMYALALGDALKNAPKLEYASFEALQADGWKVD